MTGSTRRITGSLAVAFSLTACSEAPPTPTAASPTPGAPSRVPEFSTGTWQATIDSAVWKLKFLGTGGEDNGPSLFLSNDKAGEIVHSVSLSGRNITLLSDTDCRRFVFVELDQEKLQIRSTEQNRDCRSTRLTSILQHPWRLLEGGAGGGANQTLPEGSLVSKEAFVDCALQHDDLGIVVGFRDGRAVPEPGQDVGARNSTRTSARRRPSPGCSPTAGNTSGCGGSGPDVDVFFAGHFPGPPEEPFVDTPLDQVGEEAADQGLGTAEHGRLQPAGRLAGVRSQSQLSQARPGFDDDVGAFRVPRALKHLVPCFEAAVLAAHRLVPPPGPVAGTWRTGPITLADMNRTLRAHGLAKWIGRFAEHLPIGKTPTAFSLEIETRAFETPNDWRLYTEPTPGARKTLIDYRGQDTPGGPGLGFELEGDRLVVGSEGETNVYRWSVKGDSLTLKWLKTTSPPTMGIQEEVFQRVLYETTTFRRVGQ